MNRSTGRLLTLILAVLLQLFQEFRTGTNHRDAQSRTNVPIFSSSLRPRDRSPKTS